MMKPNAGVNFLKIRMGMFNTIWKNRNMILEGIKNSVFKSEHIEEIAKARMTICETCEHIDTEGSKCIAPRTQPCCAMCGCSLGFKTRALSATCGDTENPRWHALLTTEEEDDFKRNV